MLNLKYLCWEDYAIKIIYNLSIDKAIISIIELDNKYKNKSTFKYNLIENEEENLLY